eukprot:748144-Hanusia_phi.AAC.2
MRSRTVEPPRMLDCCVRSMFPRRPSSSRYSFTNSVMPPVNVELALYRALPTPIRAQLFRCYLDSESWMSVALLMSATCCGISPRSCPVTLIPGVDRSDAGRGMLRERWRERRDTGRAMERGGGGIL